MFINLASNENKTIYLSITFSFWSNDGWIIVAVRKKNPIKCKIWRQALQSRPQKREKKPRIWASTIRPHQLQRGIQADGAAWCRNTPNVGHTIAGYQLQELLLLLSIRAGTGGLRTHHDTYSVQIQCEEDNGFLIIQEARGWSLVSQREKISTWHSPLTEHERVCVCVWHVAPELVEKLSTCQIKCTSAWNN